MFLSVCKNVIQSNNKRGWIDPDPTIRVSNTKSGMQPMPTWEAMCKTRTLASNLSALPGS